MVDGKQPSKSPLELRELAKFQRDLAKSQRDGVTPRSTMISVEMLETMADWNEKLADDLEARGRARK